MTDTKQANNILRMCEPKLHRLLLGNLHLLRETFSNEIDAPICCRNHIVKHLSSIALGQRLHTSRRRTVHNDIVLDNAICEFVVRGLSIYLLTIWHLYSAIQWVLLQFSSKCKKHCAYNFNTAELFNLSENDYNFATTLSVDQCLCFATIFLTGMYHL